MPHKFASNNNSNVTARNRRRNGNDLMPLLQEMHDDGRLLKDQQSNINDTANVVETGDIGEVSDYYDQGVNPHSSEDVMANEANFDASGAHVAFYYSGQDESKRKRRKASDSSNEDDRLAADENGFYKAEHFLYRPFTIIRRVRHALKDDFSSIFLLLLLYLLQGIPLGLIAAIPLILQSKEVTYAEQAVFSFAYWPFSMKLLWAPIVDSLYFKRLGRRKSWMVPCQYLIGVFLLVISYFASEILGTDGGKQPNVFVLMCIFLPLNFLAATQDIAVDGWALTMLSRKNVGYASTCNVVGQTFGFFLGNVVFLTLQSKDFANKWIRSVPADKGIVEFDGFVFFWGWIFIITTTLVLIFKREVDHSATGQEWCKAEPQSHPPDVEEEEMTLGVGETYKILAKIMCLKPMVLMVVVLLTAKIAFAATDSMTDLKLIAAGITSDKIASRSLFLTPLQIILPWLLGKQTAGPKPLNVFLWAYPYRVIMGIVFAVIVYWTPSFRADNGEYPYLYYGIWIAAYYLHQISSYCIFLSMMAFNAQISDPKIGGTYMTLLNTLNNLGGNWPVTLVLSVTDFFNRKNCVAVATKTVLGVCTAKHDEELCKAGGDVCEFVVDGYYISVGICTIIGLLWFRIFYNRIQYFQKIPRQEWRVIKTVK